MRPGDGRRGVAKGIVISCGAFFMSCASIQSSPASTLECQTVRISACVLTGGKTTELKPEPELRPSCPELLPAGVVSAL